MNEMKINECRNTMKNTRVLFFFTLTILVLLNTALIADVVSGNNFLATSQYYLIVGIIMSACIAAIVASMATLVLGFFIIRKVYVNREH